MKYAIALTATAGLTFGAAAHATLIDGFGDTNPGVIVNAGNPVDQYSNVVTDTDLGGTVNRTITTTWLSGFDVSSKVEGLGANPDTFFEHSQDVLTTGTSLIEWDFVPNAGTLPMPLNLQVEVISADLPGASLTFTLFDGSESLVDTIVLPAVASPQTFVFSFIDVGDVFDEDNVIEASLFIDGSTVEALDVAIDFIQVSEPGTLALIGLGLVGVAGALRRPRATA